MIGGLVATLAGSAWARTALRYGVTTIAILLLLLALRRSGERAGRLGVTFDSGMPGYGDVLSAEEIVEILDYIKSRWPERERRYQAERSASDGG